MKINLAYLVSFLIAVFILRKNQNVTAVREIKLVEAFPSCTLLWARDRFEGQFSVLHQYKIIPAQLWPTEIEKEKNVHHGKS